ncbi:hypothetical protein CYK80_02665 [Clostridium perfringens]|uniref:Uncharacterized protein n=1 Tax=Clostridium perfringens TaxID=1502 RepID=A0AB37C9F2_CLOPF|nr:hypothetical protein [Clostridium perfringens]ASY51393.1 hypothetical protein BG908_06875 [Clostridium perfringens]AWS25899.1 hypothetical protein CYK96_09860 [Clostridium perfringens]PWX42388.1 hypothetical protein CYK91_04410 [Clostridium perfringens]PZT49730.1 hypothetical protein CYK80_02665 [Clostridium perfringens]HAT4304540.1 hypothetical protein [Clostridium perfringens]
MDRKRRLEYLMRKALFCDRPQSLLTFGGLALSDCLRSEGDFYVGVILSLAVVYPRSILSQCREIDDLINDLGKYRNVKINDIPENEFDDIFERVRNLVNTILEQ